MPFLSTVERPLNALANPLRRPIESAVDFSQSQQAAIGR